MSKYGYLLIDLLISIFIGIIALMVITELLISTTLFVKKLQVEINEFVNSTFALDFIHQEIRKRYIRRWEFEKNEFYEYFGYIGMVNGREKLIVYRCDVKSSDKEFLRLMRCCTNDLNTPVEHVTCNNVIYEGKNKISMSIEGNELKRLKVSIGKNLKVINLGGIGYGL